jgi:hypothetical protein
MGLLRLIRFVNINRFVTALGLLRLWVRYYFGFDLLIFFGLLVFDEVFRTEQQRLHFI